MEDCPDDTRDETHNESTVVDISNVKLEFLKVTGNKDGDSDVWCFICYFTATNKDKPFPGPLTTHGVYKLYKRGNIQNWIFIDLFYHWALTGNNLNIGGNCAWFCCIESGPNGPCTGKAKVVYEKVTNSEGKTEYHYKYEWVSSHEVRNIIEMLNSFINIWTYRSMRGITFRTLLSPSQRRPGLRWRWPSLLTPGLQLVIQYTYSRVQKSQVNQYNKISFFANLIKLSNWTFFHVLSGVHRDTYKRQGHSHKDDLLHYMTQHNAPRHQHTIYI